MLSEEKLIKKLKRYSISAQQELYERYAVSFKHICLKYVVHESEADDLLHEAFLKIFKHINQFKSQGSFEGWMKRIVINLALTNYKNNKKNMTYCDDIQNISTIENSEYHSGLIDKKDINKDKIDFSLIQQANFTVDEMIAVVNKLKEDFRVVFQLYFFENYKHKEIAEILEIEENTSRTRLLRARTFVQKELYKLCISKVSI